MRHALADVLASMRRRLITVDAGAPMRRAVQLMTETGIGAVLVTSRNRPVGIVTERDVLRRIVERDSVDLTTPVAAAMTAPAPCAPKHMSSDEAMQLMSAERQQHLAVVEDGVPVGIVSLGDLMSLATRELEQSVIDLSTFISGPAASVELPSMAIGSRLARRTRH